MFPVAMETMPICTEPVFYTHFSCVIAHVSSVPCVMGDLAADLNSFSFEAGLDEEGKESLHLRARFAGLTFCGCAHAVFLCKLVQSLRCLIRSHGSNKESLGGDGDPRVGIIGMGHFGKQLLMSLLEKTDIKPSNIKVSSRRPETADEFIQRGVECFFDNRRLATWADLLFLCCLPSHLPKVCADLRSHLSKCSLVYSFPSAVPVARLAHLLGHDFILKPQCDFGPCATADLCLSCTPVAKALMDPLLIEASCPLALSGNVSLGLTWVCAVLYSILNICTSARVGSSTAVSLINSLLNEKCPHTVEFNTQSFISPPSASALPPEEPFPWISLTDVQTRTTPLLCLLSGSKSMQQCISALYTSLLETPQT